MLHIESWEWPGLQGYVCTGLPFNYYNMQMIGRAGRNGDPARAHLFYSTRQLKKVSDQAVIDLCVSNENCRRLCILNGIGGIKEQENEKCCDTCTCGIVPYPKLDILKPKSIQRKKRLLPVRIINDDLKSALIKRLTDERTKIIDENPGYRMLGFNFVCPDSAINKISEKAVVIDSIDTLKTVTSCIRPEILIRLYSVVMDSFLCTPC